MIMLAALAVLTLTVPLAGGNLLHMRDPEFRHSWLLFSALAVQLLITVVATAALPVATGRALHLLSYALAFGWVGLNRHVTGLWVTAIGGATNLAAIAANGGQMPATEAALEYAGMSELSQNFVNSGLVEGGARLQLLGDIFAVPAAWPLSNVFSIGDVVLVVGGGLIIHHLAGSTWIVADEHGNPAPLARVRGAVRPWVPTATVLSTTALLVRTSEGLVIAAYVFVVVLVVDPGGPANRRVVRAARHPTAGGRDETAEHDWHATPQEPVRTP